MPFEELGIELLRPSSDGDESSCESFELHLEKAM